MNACVIKSLQINNEKLWVINHELKADYKSQKNSLAVYTDIFISCSQRVKFVEDQVWDMIIMPTELQ